ncbi:DNA excision repair protein, putative [Leishmania panamensis]|uniref:DNA excision repair protein, putative n=2 Tax=Leishmania guyanensis species complex TaxID=38579 RepID=A0A088RR53_LEIPA|nr:DNA excision repair protein, putative [Leishmania panamensis]AIN98592.1 DNA excision repair protein, putative [Leishmania panamensis]
MGIKGLWQALREYVDDGHLSQFRGQRVAVDMYVWLHRCVHRSVRIRTEAVIAFFDAKYSSITGSTGADSLDSRGDTATLASPSPAPLSLDDILVIDDQFVTLVLDKVSALQRFGVIPVCVFDGAEMPMKGGTDEERQRRRAEAFQGALTKLEQLYCDARRRRGCTAEDHADGTRIALPRDTRPYEEAVQLLAKAADISTELAHAVIQVLKEERHVECIVAPYEADAQLAYLCRQGYVVAAASEDSDLIAYYCPCIISKLDTFSGKCEVLQPPLCAPHFFRRMAATRVTTSTAATMLLKSATANRRAAAVDDAIGHGHDGVNSVHARMRASALKSLQCPHYSFNGAVGASTDEGAISAAVATAFTYESFLLGCILSGCDYVPNLRSIGVKKAFKLVAHATSLRQCFTTLEREFGFPADELRRYRHRILEAFYCFAHHLVYSPLTQEIVTYHPLPGTDRGGTAELKTRLVGQRWSAQIAQEVCVQCLKDPCTLQLYRGVYQPCVTQYLQRTRRGQTSLRAYAGFQEMSSSRVVVHVEKQQRDGLATSQREHAQCSFGPPLKKQRVASGFLGSSAALPQTSSSSQQPAEVVVVRSRFFMVRGRTAVCEQWSTSETDNEGDVESGESKEPMVVPRRAAVCPADPMIDPNTGCRSPFSSLAHRPSSPALLSITRAASGTLTDDSASGVGSTVTSTVRCTAGMTGANETWEMSDVRNTSDCARRDETAESLSTVSWMGMDGASASAASLLCRTSSTLFMGDSESMRDEECGVEGEDMARHAPVVREGARKVGGLTEIPGVEPYVHGIAQDTNSTVEAAGAQGMSSAPSPPRCDCPFGYWQCNRAHSVFESCFVGRHWSHDEGPLPSSSLERPTARASASVTGSSATLSPSPASPLQRLAMSPVGSVASGYVSRAFRPPRSTAAASAPPLPAAGKSQATPLYVCNTNAKGVDLAVLRSSSKAEPLAAAPLTLLPSSAFLSSPADGDATSRAAPPPLPTPPAAVHVAIFEKMSFKKT